MREILTGVIIGALVGAMIGIALVLYLHTRTASPAHQPPQMVRI